MLTIVDARQNTYPIDVDASIEIENLKAIVESDTGVPAEYQQLAFQDAILNDAKKPVSAFGVSNGDLLILSDVRVELPSQETGMNSSMVETMRNQILSSTAIQNDLRAVCNDSLPQSNPALLEASLSSSKDFQDTLARQREQLAQMQSLQQLANSDPFDVESQRRIEEAIRQQHIAENMEHAMEYTPEAFGNVTMLYVNLKVNGHPVKAFVDSGAQATIVSPECAERCGIIRLLDTRFSGMAKGVGTAKILGRIHSTQIQMGEKLFLPCAFTVLEGASVDMLFGLDMLKRYQASIDLRQNALIIDMEKIPFLAEHELPKNELTDPTANDQAAQLSRKDIESSPSHPNESSTAKPMSMNESQKHLSQESLSTLLNLGIEENIAKQLLNASNGDPETAASIYFQNL